MDGTLTAAGAEEPAGLVGVDAAFKAVSRRIFQPEQLANWKSSNGNNPVQVFRFAG